MIPWMQQKIFGQSPSQATHLQRQERDADSQRFQTYKQAWDYYSGNHELTFLIVSRPNAPSQDDNVTTNFCQLIVDKSTDFLIGPGIKMLVTAKRDSGDPKDIMIQINPPPQTHEMQEALDDVWAEAHMNQRLTGAAINGSVTGDCFIMMRVRSGMPRPLVINPGAVRVRHRPGDYEDVVAYQIDAMDFDANGLEVNLRQMIRQVAPDLDANDEQSPDTEGAEPTPIWVIEDWINYPQEGTAEYELVGSEVWAFPWCPLIHWQHNVQANSFWGMPDLTKSVIDINRSINSISSNINAVGAMYATPKLVVKNMTQTSAGTIDMSRNTAIGLPSPDQDIKVLEYNTNNLQGLLDFLGSQVDSMLKLSSVPEVSTGVLEHVGNLTGLALQLLYHPLTLKTQKKREITYRDGLSLIAFACLQIIDYYQGKHWDFSTVRFEPVWSNALPTDDMNQAIIAQIAQALGVSHTTIMSMLGLDPKKEAAQRKTDAMDTTMPTPPPTQTLPNAGSPLILPHNAQVPKGAPLTPLPTQTNTSTQ